MSSKNSKVNRIQKYRTMITGVQTNVGTKTTIVIRGTATSQPGIVSSLQGYIDAADATAAALAAYHEAVAKQDLAAVAANVTYLGVKAYALTQYANQASTVGEFGLQLPTRKTPDVATKAAANVKREATRTAKTPGATPAATPAPAGSTVTTTTKS